MYGKISDDKLYFDPAWYTEQILNSPTEGEKFTMETEGKQGADDIAADNNEEEEESPQCCCCAETDCRLRHEEWTDD